MSNITRDDRDKLSPVWDLSQERVLTMTLINQRINFFVVFFSIVISGALNAKLQIYQSLILGVGACLSWMLAFPIYFTQMRVDKIMGLIREDESHPYTIVSKLAGGHVRVSALVSYGVTTLCCALLTIGAILSAVGRLPVVPK